MGTLMGTLWERAPCVAARLLKLQKEMARPKRFELLTPRFVVWCSIQLSYGRVTEMLVRAVSHVVNSTATAASRQNSRNLAAAKLKRKSQRRAHSSHRRVKRR